MKYCIYQIDDKMNEKIIDVIDEDEFLDTIKDKIEDKYNFKLLETVNELDIKTNSCFKENYYLLVNDKHIKLVQKYKKTNSGYMYSTSKDAIIILFTWKLLPFECSEIITNNYVPINTSISLISDNSDSNMEVVEYINDQNL